MKKNQIKEKVYMLCFQFLRLFIDEVNLLNFLVLLPYHYLIFKICTGNLKFLYVTIINIKTLLI